MMAMRPFCMQFGRGAAPHRGCIVWQYQSTGLLHPADGDDRMTTSYQDIQAQIRELTMAAAEARKAELNQALDTIRELIRQYDLTQDDLLGLFRKRRGRADGANVAPATKGVPKYRDPETGRTWTGQGKPPNWIKDAPDRSVYLIEGSAASTAKKSGRRGPKRAAATKRVGRKRSAA